MTQALPALGAHVVISPLPRTVRNAARQPELDARGEPKKQLATVYIDGQKIEQPTRVKVTIAVIRQLRAGNLGWQSLHEHLQAQRAERRKLQKKASAVSQRPAASSESAQREPNTAAAPKPAVSRPKKSQEQSA